MGFCDIDKDFSEDIIENDEEFEEERKVSYESKSIMTEFEKEFYRKLEVAVPSGYIIQCQVPLSAIIKKISTSKYANELYRTIDFGII
ncbi:MAG: DUF2726 domain-containing protein, partial [Clostridia bacterium]|nr:DUF2726 domain-containing protein [Clostridia bacterium]